MSLAPKPAPQVIELRQYTLHPGRRDELIELFEREFVDSQEALGLRVLGTFRDLDHADRSVWLRGFADMASRAPALAAFYDGPVWRRHRDAANATMIDSDDVLLLRPVSLADGWAQALSARAGAARGALVTITLCFLNAAADTQRIERMHRLVESLWARDGSHWIASLATEPAKNDFPRLPVRENESVLAWIAGFDDEQARAAHARRLDASSDWSHWCRELLRPPETLRLAPTAGRAVR